MNEIQIEEYVAKCREHIEAKSVQAAGELTVRVPSRPMVVTFLGGHPAEGKRRFDLAMKAGWPTAYFRIGNREQAFPTPEAFQDAISQEDSEGSTEIDRVILDATNDPGLRSSNLLMVYFIDFNSDASDAFLRLLDCPYTTPMGGVKERIIFAIGKTTTNRALRQAQGFADTLQSIAGQEASAARALWERTSCVLLSNYKYGGMTLTEQEYLDNYSLAMDILLMQYSNPNDTDKFRPIALPRVTDTAHPFMTATLHRESKPSEQIARTVLYQYFRNGLSLANAAEAGEASVVTLRQNSVDAIMELYRALYEGGKFPSDGAMRHFPGGAVSGVDAGLSGKEDKTLGTWQAFCQRYFVRPVLAEYGDRRWLKDYFARYFSKNCGYSCGTIQKLFPTFKNDLADTGEEAFLELTRPEPAAKLRDWGLYEARKALGHICFAALKDAVSELSVAAGNYAAMLATLSGQVTPSDDSVRGYYSNIADAHMGAKIGDDTVEDLLKRPCGGNELAKRLDSYIESITNQPAMRKNFFDELRTRLADDGANTMITNFLTMPAHTLINNARMHVGVLDAICEAAMFDSALLGVTCSNLFELCGTNGMDRVVLYGFDARELRTGVAG